MQSILGRIKHSLYKLYKSIMGCTPYQKFFLILSLYTLISITVFSFTSANWYMDSDTATANLLAEAMVREGSMFPEGWTYGQDIWVFFLHQPIAFFTLFSDNYLAMRSVSAMLFIAMALACCIYFSRKVLKSNAWIVAVPLLFCGISYEYSYMVFGQCAYLPQVIFLFLTPALFFDALDSDFRIKSKLSFGILLVWLAFLAMSGIRNIQSVGIPLLGAMLLVFFIDKHDNSLSEIKRPIGVLITKCFIIGTAILVGFAIFLFLSLKTNYSIGVLGGLQISDNNIFISKLSTLVSFALNIYNINSGADLVSVNGILSLIGVLSISFLGFIFPVLQFKKYKAESREVKLFLMFSLVHIAEVLVLFLFTTLYATPRYLLSVQILLVFISAHYVYKYILPKISLLRTLVVVVLLSMFSLPQSTLHLLNATKHGEMMAPHYQTVDFFEENDLTYGYATYWHAGKYTVLSNGNVEINGIQFSGDTVIPYYWLNDMKRYTNDTHNGSSFIMVTPDEKQIFLNSKSYALMGEPIKILEYGEYTIYVYDYNVGAYVFSGKTE